MVKRKLCNTRQISATPFEVFYNGYWHWTDNLRVKNGVISCQLGWDGCESEKQISSHDIRLQSKKATTFDCRGFLRPGMDICIHIRDPDQEKDPVFQDARIISVARQPHGDRCACVFFVKFYVKEANSNNRRFIAGKDEVTIEGIYILQRLLVEYRRDGKRSWEFSENCAFIQKSRLVAGPFGSEFAWLIVLSIAKGMEFSTRLVGDRIMYVVVDSPHLSGTKNVQSVCDTKSDIKEEIVDDSDISYPRTSTEMKILLLEMVDGKVVPRIESSDHVLTDCKPDIYPDIFICHDMFGPRRSARQRTTTAFYASFSNKQDLRKDLRKQRGHFQTIEVEPDDSSEVRKVRRKLGDQRESSEDSEESSENAWKNDEMEEVIHCTNSKDGCSGSSKHGGRKRKSGEAMENMQEDSKHTPRSSTCSSRGYALSSRKSARRVFLSSDECDNLIGNCMKNIKTKMRRKPQIVFDMDASYYAGPMDFDWEPPDASRVEEREHEDLWKDMEYALSILPLLEDKEDTSTSDSSKDLNFATNNWENSCRHDPFLDEELGIICRFCKAVITERRYILPSFACRSHESRDRETIWHCRIEPLFDDLLGAFGTGVSTRPLPPPCKSKDVWSLIPELESKLYPHQKKAFEFLWKNIAGSLRPCSASLPRNSGGCIISHSPGTGKTLLVFSFLVSYLRAFNGRHPLILTPKITLCVWTEEFRKWGVPIPLYTIHTLDTYRKNCQRSPTTAAHDVRRPSLRWRHILDCLEKLKKWHDEPSVLLMSYSSFSLLAQDNSRSDPHRQFIADVLRKSPGLLVLDEGHNPRSTQSKLRALLMQVKTRLRILLSGTLFQNNFTEYFNTLCLAKPGFAHDAMKELSSRGSSGNGVRRRGGKAADSSEEEVARRAFAQQIGRRLESKKESERRMAFHRLMQMTGGFVDVYAGGGSCGLPGLEVYTIILESMPAQKGILDKLQSLRKPNRYSWELEILVTVASIHPCLVRSISAACISSYFSEKELEDIARLGGKYPKGSKMKFVMDVVHKCMAVKREKVLIFCHNIAPIEMLVEMFTTIFGWERGREILILRGEQELFVRERTIARFKEGSSKVLLASTTASSEGISLTAASRVILMDSEWNHSRTQQAVARAFRPGQERVVYVYQLLAAGTLEEDKYRTNERKEWLSKMIATGQYVEHSDCRRVSEVEDDVLMDIVEEGKMKVFRYSV